MSEKSGFEELMSQVGGFVFHPLMLSLPGFAVFCMLLVFMMPKLARNLEGQNHIDRLKQELGMHFFPSYVLIFCVFLWGMLSLTLVFGLLTLLIEIVWNTLPSDTDEGKADFRFLLTKTTALTAVLGALVALPFTVIRLKLTTEQNRHNADVLFNEKLNNANADLHAMRQVTVPVLDKNGKETTKRETIWTDDIIRRNGAIDRLGVLASEGDYEQRSKMAPQIARMLCVYLREMTHDYPAETMPKGTEPNEIWKWANDLKLQRSDMEAAAQVLGLLDQKTEVPTIELDIDLTGVNLQAMQLSGLNFAHSALNKAALDGAKLYGTRLYGAQLHGAKLNGTKLDGATLDEAQLFDAQLNWAELNWTKLNGTKLEEAELNGAKLIGAELNKGTSLNGVHAASSALRLVNLKDVPNLNDLVASAFGDSTVNLPDDIKPLVKDKWPDYALDQDEYNEEWERFKEDPDSYVPPQLREN